ncbi:MAG: YfhO family protein [Candidatus Binatia bacterium]
MEAAAWIGFGALGVVSIVERGTLRSTTLLAGAAAMSLLAGAPQHSAYLMYAWGTLWLARTVTAEQPIAAAARSGALFGAAILLALLLSAAQLLPTAQIMAEGTRSTSQLPARVISPLGNPAVAMLERFPIVGLSQSFGVMPLVLAALAALGGRHLGLLVWALLLGVVSAVFALGAETSVFGVYRMLPGLGMFRGPNRMLLLTDFSMAVAAAITIDAFVRGPDASASRRARIAVATIVVAAAVAWTVFHVRLGTPGASLVAVGIAAGGATLLLVRGTRVAIVAAGVVLLLVGTEIFVRTDLRLVLPYTMDKVKWLQLYDQSYRLLSRQGAHDRIWLIVAADPQSAAKQAMRNGLRSIEDYEPMNLIRQNRYLTYFGEGAVTDYVNDLPFFGTVPGRFGSSPTSSAGSRRRLLDLGAVGRIIIPPKASQGRATSFFRAAGLRAGAGIGTLAVAVNPNANARAYVVYQTAQAPAETELLARLADPTFDPLALAYVEGDPGFTPTADAPARGAEAQFVEDGEDVVEVEATATTAGLLVLADTNAPGWLATVDGATAPIVATNYLFRGVAIPSGKHRVRFLYRPWTIPAGQVISLASLLVLGLMVVRPRLPGSSASV